MNNTINGYRPVKNSKVSFGSFGPQLESLLTKPEVAKEIVKTRRLTELLPKIKESELHFDFSKSSHPVQVSIHTFPGNFYEISCTEPKHKVVATLHSSSRDDIYYEDYFENKPELVVKALMEFKNISREHAKVLKNGAKTEKNISALDINIKLLQESIDAAKEEVKNNAIETVKKVMSKDVDPKSKKIPTEAQIKKMENQLKKQKSEREKLSGQTTKKLLENKWANKFSIDVEKKTFGSKLRGFFLDNWLLNSD